MDDLALLKRVLTCSAISPESTEPGSDPPLQTGPRHSSLMRTSQLNCTMGTLGLDDLRHGLNCYEGTFEMCYSANFLFFKNIAADFKVCIEQQILSQHSPRTANITKTVNNLLTASLAQRFGSTYNTVIKALEIFQIIGCFLQMNRNGFTMFTVSQEDVNSDEDVFYFVFMELICSSWLINSWTVDTLTVKIASDGSSNKHKKYIASLRMLSILLTAFLSHFCTPCSRGGASFPAVCTTK